MSIWEIEDLVEQTVRFAATTSIPATDRLALMAQLYDIQDQFDCQNTRGRTAALRASLGPDPSPAPDPAGAIVTLLTLLANEPGPGGADALHGWLGLSLRVLPHATPPVAPGHPELAAALVAIRDSGHLLSPCQGWVRERFPRDPGALEQWGFEQDAVALARWYASVLD